MNADTPPSMSIGAPGTRASNPRKSILKSKKQKSVATKTKEINNLFADPVKKKTFFIAVIAISSAVVIGVILTLTLMIRKKTVTSSSSGTASTNGPIISGNQWMSEPITGPYPYQFGPAKPYYIEMKVNPFDLDGAMMCIDHPGFLEGIRLGIDVDGKLYHSRAGIIQTSLAAVALNVAHTFAISFDGVLMRMWMDDVEVAAEKEGGNISINIFLPLIIGARMGNSDTNIDGFIGGEYFYIKIYNKADFSTGTLLAYYDMTTNNTAETGTEYVNQGDNGTDNVLTIRDSTTYIGIE